MRDDPYFLLQDVLEEAMVEFLLEKDKATSDLKKMRARLWRMPTATNANFTLLCLASGM